VYCPLLCLITGGYAGSCVFKPDTRRW
jgi:hypothetical protein